MTLSAISAFGDEIALDLEEQLEVLRDHRVTALELRTAWGSSVIDLDSDQLDRAAAMLDVAHVAVSAIASPVGKAAVDGDVEAELVRLRAGMKAAQRLGTKLIRVFSFYIPERQHQRFRDEVLHRMSQLAREAAAQDLVLVHENELAIYGDDAEHCRDLVESIGSPALQVAFDPANFVQAGVRPFDEAWPLLADHVVHFHVKDAVSDGGVRPAGDGEGQVADLLRALERRSYGGYLVVEHLHELMPDGSGAEHFSVALSALRRLLEHAAQDLSIRPESLDSDDARRLVTRLDAGLTELYAPEQRFGPNLRPEHLEAGRGTFLVARANGRAVGCGAICILDSTTAEVKRMFVEPDQRGRGVGRAVLADLEAEARRFGASRLVLETGIHQQAAISLYRGAGFVEVDCWGEYASSPTSVCFAKDLKP